MRGPTGARVVTSPEPAEQREGSILGRLGTLRQTTFDRLLPPDPTRRDVARTFAALLGNATKTRSGFPREGVAGGDVFACGKSGRARGAE